MPTLRAPWRPFAALAALVFAGCGGAAPAAPSTTPDPAPSAVRPADEGLASTQSFVDALRSYAGPDGSIDAVLVERVAWRVYVTSIFAFALEGVSPAEQGRLVGPWEDELGRAGTEELARAYAAEWREAVLGAECIVTRGAIPDEPLFPRADRVGPEHRARVEAELARAAELEALYEVRCGDRGFRVGVLRGRPDLVPML
jgi:hypothetical protein